MLATLVVGAVPAFADPGPVVPATADEKFTDEAMATLSEEDSADFWVRFADRADLTSAAAIPDWDERGVAVHEALTSTAAAAQADTIAALEAAGASFTPRWITNAILVQDGTLELAQSLATSAEVLEIRETTTYPGEVPVEEVAGTQGLDAVEWGVQAINADDVWSQLGVTGEGIVVANIDSGVDGDHPALMEHYRGYNGDGTFTNDYNWFDVAGACGDVPCDTDDHGSHTMGTIAGGDGGDNQIGVAPGAEWIAANGCSTCADADLIASGEWIVAPTDSEGGNPDPSMRPHVVNNSWGSTIPTNDPFMEDVIAAWEAAGVFGTWSNGNSGPSCETSGSPGSRTITYSVGAFDSNGAIASFSARGPGQDGTVKPNIAAPGVSIRSAFADGTYGSMSGTSMAAPHLAGAIALLWSAAPSLVGDIAGTQALLDETALDVDDTSCGGTETDNNVWGEGRLDALALLLAAPIGDAGTLAGTVTDETGAALAGASVQVEGPTERTVTTSDEGAFSLGVVAGDYTVTASAFGFEPGSSEVAVVAGETTTVPLSLVAAAAFAVSGTVTDAGTGEPVEGASVSLDAPIEPVTTGADGTYAFAEVPTGTYTLSVTAGACAAPATHELTVDGNVTLDVTLEAVTDAFGYYCTVGAADYRQGADVVDLTGDESTATIDLPFAFSLYGESYEQVHVSSNGHLNFLAPVTAFSNVALPAAGAPNAAVYPFWDDLQLDAEASVLTASTEVEGDAAFVVEYRNVKPYGAAATQRLSFSATLVEDGRVIFGYGDLTPADDPRAAGASATIGIENADGTVAHQYSFDSESISTGLSITYALPPHGYVQGVVTDANDGLAVAGATVTATPADGGDPVVVTTDEAGAYEALLFFGSYTVEISAPGYEARSTDVIIEVDGERNTFSPELETGIAEVAPSSYSWVLTEGESRTADLTVTNSGSSPLVYSIGELPRNVQTEGKAPALSMGAQSTTMVPTEGATTLDEAQTAVTEVAEAAAAADTEATTAAGLYTADQEDALRTRTITPDAPGDVLAEWDPGLGGVAWGVGYTGDVWISDAEALTNHQFSTDGTEQASYPASWGGSWPGDLTQNTSTGDLCQVNVGGDNAIVCFDPATGEETGRLTGSPWSAVSQRGVAYDAGDDVFYIGGWNEGVIYTVAGFSHGNPGETLSSCEPDEPGIAGIAYNPTSDTIWFVPSVASTAIYQISPEDCSTLSTVGFPNTGEYPGAGLEMDASGALWATDQLTGGVYLIDVGDPSVSDVPWLTVDPAEGTVPPGESATLEVAVDTSGLEPGVYGANIQVQTTAGRVPTITVPVTLVVSAYQVAVNAGGAEHTDADELTWSADQALAGNAWGWVGQRSEVETTTDAIGGTSEDALYQSRRTGSFSYVFDDAPAGTYEITLGFAEFDELYGERERLFDVLVDGEYQLVALDVAEDVGGLYADRYVLVVEHDGGDLEVEFLNRRSYEYPIVNALSVTERSDLSAL
ncbi:hypothetical protein GCM10027067_18140 [Pseudactinotalea suaedae]